jgi:CBS domain containing-hemolysin-like protein
MTLFLIIVFLALLLLAANFSALETVLFALERQAGSAKINPLLRDPRARLHEVLLLGGGSNLLLAALGLHFTLGPLHRLGWNPWLAGSLIFGLVMLVVEIIPKACALHAPEKTLFCTLPPLRALQVVFSPVAKSLLRITESLLVIFTPKRLKPKGALDLEEVRTLVELREEQGAISAEESIILQEIIKLEGLRVKDCMTPRVDLPLMPHDASDVEAARMLEAARARFVLVFDEKADAIINVVDTEAWRLAQHPAWQRLAEPPVLVPETMSVLEALGTHLKTAASAVVIVDEYGGFEGLLAHGNIVERLIGKAAPAPSSELAIQSLSEGRWLVNGSARLDEVNRELEIELDAEGVETVGGLVFSRFGYLPKPGERLELDGVTIKVKRTARNRVTQLEIRVAPTNDEGGGI